MKTERSDVKFPMWRKKVDSSLFQYNGTTIPQWVSSMWCLENYFSNCNSKKKDCSKVNIYFEDTVYKGWVTVAIHKRKTPTYRLWFSDDLNFRLKDIFIMSFMRDIEARLRNDKKLEIEEEISFWEFIDIEYDIKQREFYFTAYYVQKPSFPELFKRLISSPVLHKVDDELNNKDTFRIHKQDWKPKSEFEYELGAQNVVYTLIDTEKKLLYVGEAQDLIKRFKQGHKSIKNWNYFKYNVLPKQLEKHRKTIERMVIRDYATLLENKKGINCIKISDYKLANDKIDK